MALFRRKDLVLRPLRSSRSRNSGVALFASSDRLRVARTSLLSLGDRAARPDGRGGLVNSGGSAEQRASWSIDRPSPSHRCPKQEVFLDARTRSLSRRLRSPASRYGPCKTSTIATRLWCRAMSNRNSASGVSLAFAVSITFAKQVRQVKPCSPASR